MAERSQGTAVGKDTKGEQEWKQRKTGASVIAAFIVILDILALTLGLIIATAPVALSLGCVGVITFVGMLTLSNYLSHDPALSKGEMRKAIAASLILVYLNFLAFVVFGKVTASEAELAKTIVGHFTTVVGIVIVFYFGSRSVEEYLKTKGQKENQEEEPE